MPLMSRMCSLLAEPLEYLAKISMYPGATGRDSPMMTRAECDSAWRSWEKTTAQLYQHAEALQTHPGTMDALLQHENHAQEQIQAAIQGSLSTLCTRELVPGVKRVLAAQAKPFGELVRSLVPHAVTARAMLTKVVQLSRALGGGLVSSGG